MLQIEKAVALDTQAWLNTLPREVPAYAFSAPYLKFIAKLTDKMRGDKYHRFTKKATAVVIIAAILLSISIVALAATVGKDFILKHFNGYAQVEVSDVEKSSFVANFVLTYIPEGFNKTDEFVSQGIITYSYSNNDSWFDISKEEITSDIGIDEEYGSVLEIEYKGKKYLLSEDESGRALIWNDGKYLYDINGTLSKEELLKIAQGAR